MRVWRLSVWRLTSVAYIGPKSRIERPRKTKIGTEVAHVTRGSDTTFKVKWSKVKASRARRRHIVAASRTACWYWQYFASVAINTAFNKLCRHAHSSLNARFCIRRVVEYFELSRCREVENWPLTTGSAFEMSPIPQSSSAAGPNIPLPAPQTDR